MFSDLALRFGNIIGGLLNATFGNIVEVILSIAALERGLYIVVATSLVGSVLSNLLLVLGKRLRLLDLRPVSLIVPLYPAIRSESDHPTSQGKHWITAPCFPPGCCFLFGGMYHKIQTFNATSNRACSSLLFLAAIGVAIPTAARFMMSKNNPDREMSTLWISRGTAIILLFW